MKELTDILQIAQNTLTNNLHVVLAYMALMLSIGWKYRYIYALKKSSNDMAAVAVKATAKLDDAVAVNDKLTKERQAWLKQLKQERELKGQAQQRYENLAKRLN